jgi:hypothetical protein
MKKLMLVLVLLGLAAASFAADDNDNKAANRVKSASTILEEIQTAPDIGIPDEVMGSAQCVYAEGRIRLRRELWTRRRQLPHRQGMERSRVFHD